MNRALPLVLGMVLIFAASVGVLLYVLPAPHKPTDYLVTGAVGTLLCLVLLFAVLMKGAKRPASKPDSEA
jgi:multisubunit Na+/H+ antiporter MnhG subunit